MTDREESSHLASGKDPIDDGSQPTAKRKRVRGTLFWVESHFPRGATKWSGQYATTEAQIEELVWRDGVSREDRDVIRDLVNQKDHFYSDAAAKSEASAEIYLMTTNAGGAIAIIGAATSDIADINMATAGVALSLFATSIMFIGIIKAIRIARTYYIRGEFRKACRVFFSGTVSLADFLEVERRSWRNPKVMISLAWGAFILFWFGVVFGLLSITI